MSDLRVFVRGPQPPHRKVEPCTFVPVMGRWGFADFGIDHFPWLRICEGCGGLDAVEVVLHSVQGKSTFTFWADGDYEWCRLRYHDHHCGNPGWDWKHVTGEFGPPPKAPWTSFFGKAWKESLAQAMADPVLTYSGDPRVVIRRAADRGRAMYEEFTAAVSPEAQSL